MGAVADRTPDDSSTYVFGRNADDWRRHLPRPALVPVRAGDVRRRLLVDASGLVDGAQYDRHLEGMHRTPVLEVSGEVRFLVTVARQS